jgi:Domain of Unknown Function (DUF326)
MFPELLAALSEGQRAMAHMEHCRVCAEACRACEQACHELLGAAA